jgi:hypothetical protein
MSAQGFSCLSSSRLLVDHLVAGEPEGSGCVRNLAPEESSTGTCARSQALEPYLFATRKLVSSISVTEGSSDGREHLFLLSYGERRRRCGAWPGCRRKTICTSPKITTSHFFHFARLASAPRLASALSQSPPASKQKQTHVMTSRQVRSARARTFYSFRASSLLHLSLFN